MAKETPGDQAVTDLEELSDLLSEVGTLIADQNMEDAQELWKEVVLKYVSLNSDLSTLFQEEDEGSDD